MAGRLTLWGAGEILRTFFGRTAEPPADYYLALIKDKAPTAYDDGDVLDEPVESGYARVRLENVAITWTDDGELHVVSNADEIKFLTPVADWGSIGFWALCNAPEGGNVYFVGEMEEPVIIREGVRPLIEPRDLVIELGPFFVPESEL